MLTIGDTLPAFSLFAVDIDTPAHADAAPAFKHLNQDSFPGQWKVLLCWPREPASLCPTEIKLYGELVEALTQRNSVLLGVSIASAFEQLAERHEQGLKFAWLADAKGELCDALGIRQAHSGEASRALFIVDPDNRLRHVSVNDPAVGRNPQETLRILDTLQSVELWPQSD